MNLNGLCNVNVELTDMCNKNCWCCGRRKREKENPAIIKSYGYMPFNLIRIIAEQLPTGITTQLHNNGEPLLYPRLGDAIKLFKNQITGLDTNGKLLVKKADEIIGNLDTLTISVIENDEEALEQFHIIKKFLELKGDRKPLVTLRLNGNVDYTKYEELNTIIAKRILHAPQGSFNYTRQTTIPEMGICLDFLHHLSINKDGDVSICVRYDPNGLGILGNIRRDSLDELWNSPKRMKWFKLHKQGRRKEIPLCSFCQFWGIPTGG